MSTSPIIVGCNSGIYQGSPGNDFSSVVTQPPSLGTRGYRDNVIIDPSMVPTAFGDITGVNPLMSIRPHPDYFLSSGSHYNDLYNGSAVGPQIVAAIQNMVQNGCTNFGAKGLKPRLSTWHEAGNLYTNSSKLDSNGVPFTNYVTSTKIVNVHIAMQSLVNTVNASNVGHEVRYGPITYFSQGASSHSPLSQMENWLPTSAHPMDWYGVDTYDNSDQDLSTLTKIQNYLAPYYSYIQSIAGTSTPVICIPECNSPTEANRPWFFKNLANWLYSNGAPSTALQGMYSFFKCGGNSGGCWLPNDSATIAAFNYIQNNYGAPTGSNPGGGGGGGGGGGSNTGNSTIALDQTHQRRGAGCLAMTSVAAGDYTASHCNVNNAVSEGYPCIPGQLIDLQAWLKAATTPRQCQVGARFTDASGNFLSVVMDTTHVINSNTSTYTECAGFVTAPSGAYRAILIVKAVGATAGGETHYVDDCQIGGTGMNDPTDTNLDFIGSIDMRGLTDNLNLLLQPPMCVVSAASQTQTQPSGANSSPQIFWDTVHIDTIGGMGAIPGWPNWYVCLVPGWYEIDGCITATNAATGTNYWQGWIVVAEKAAQALAAGVGTPTTVSQYVCPVGETQRLFSVTMNEHSNPTTRMYLGLGDMVTLAAEATASTATGTGNGGSHFSIVYKGIGTSDDRVEINTSISSGGTVTDPTPSAPGTKIYTNTHTYSYYGNEVGGKRINTDGSCYQSAAKGYYASTGSQKAQIAFNYSQIASDLAGHTIQSVTLTATNKHTWYGSGGNLLIGVCFDTPGGKNWNPKTSSNSIQAISKQKFSEGQKLVYTLPNSIISYFTVSGAKALCTGQLNDSNLNDYGYWAGGPGAWTLTVNYI